MVALAATVHDDYSTVQCEVARLRYYSSDGQDSGDVGLDGGDLLD